MADYMDHEDFNYNKPLTFGVWKKIFPLIRPQMKLLVRCALFMLSVAVVDVLFPLILGYVLKHNIEPRTMQGLWKVLSMAIIIMTVQAVNVRVFVALGLRIECYISRAIRNAVFNKLQLLSLSYYNKTPVGYMMARTNSDTSRIGDIIAWGLVDFSWSIFYCVGVMFSMFMLHLKMALIVSASMIPLSLFTWYFQKRILSVNRIMRKLNSKMTGAMNEGITGSRTIKVLVAQEQSLAEFSQITGEYRFHANRMARLRSTFIPLVLFIGAAASAVILGYGGREIIILGAEISVLAIFLQYAGGLFHPIQNIARILTDFVSTQANVERVSDILEQEEGITDRPEVIAQYGDTSNPKKENWEPINGDIEFRDVTFMYPDGHKNVLEHFNLHISRGTYAAIVGETGAGKSTLVNLVCRFFEPSLGNILIDGRDYRERSQLWLHSNLGYVLQSPHLFTGTIRENIRYGKLDASDADIENAVNIIHASAIINKLNNGLDTEIGEGGDKLSTGEKQLVSFARAVLADPKIFILDEATSSIDTEMEMLLQDAIRILLKDRTSFVIAHRLSTIRNADIILVVHDGKIIERGNHRELMAQKGRYFDLYTRQFEEETEEKVLSEH
jgi:ATP-binding cassette subfamily B protein